MKHYPHHISDFNNATRHLNRIERGLYRDLIELYYETEKPLPVEVVEVARRIVANELSTDVERMLNEFFIQTPQGWYHVRCDEEISKYQGNNSQRALAGKASAAKKALKKHQALNGDSTVVEIPLNENATGIQNQSTNKPINHKLVKEGERAKALTRPDDVDAQVWSDWVQLRKAKKAPITETVLKTARKEAALADMPLVNFLEIWCARGSIGLEAAWLRNTDKSQASETVYQKSMRLRVAEISPALARPEPGRIGPDDFFANLAKQNRELANLTVLEIAP